MDVRYRSHNKFLGKGTGGAVLNIYKSVQECSLGA